MIKLAIFLFFASLLGYSADKADESTIQSIMDTYPERLVQKGRMSNNDEAFFTRWKRQVLGSDVSAKIRWDGGHDGGYCKITIGKRTFPAHISFKYAGQVPKAPKYGVKLREKKCRKGGGKHYTITRTGKEITIFGTLVSFGNYPSLCKSCGASELLEITIKAEKVE